MLFCCPVCRQPLMPKETGASLVCVNRHCFDRAAEGYYHLLPSHKMHTKQPGDNKGMVSARRQFLQAGYYQLFSDGINQTVKRLLTTPLSLSLSLPQHPHSQKAAPVLLDAGCGEGYYTARLIDYLYQQKIYAQTAGFDISKFAIKAAAKRDSQTEYAVASIFDIPVPDQACDLLLNIFAPIVPKEFARVLKPDGYLLIAVPSERHLFGLKEILYDRPYENEQTDTVYEGFELIERVPLRGEMIIEDPQQIQNLFSMTPYYWKTPPAGSERLSKQRRLTTEIGFDLVIYQRERDKTHPESHPSYPPR